MDTGVNLDALALWMEARNLGRGPIENAARLTGGTQNILMRFTRDGRDYVLRRPPISLRANSNETMRREARVLEALKGTDVPHPGFIAACEDESVLGAAFYLMEPVDGFNPASEMPALHAGSPAARRRMGLSLVEASAKLGRLDYRALGLDGLGKPENYLERQVARWKAQLASYGAFKDWPGPDAIPGVARVADWLDANRPDDFRPGVIHGDYHIGNVMFRRDSPEVAAIVDWELTTIGDPMVDLGWLLATWPRGEAPERETIKVTPWAGFPSADELVAHYGAHAGRDTRHARWYAVLACYKLGIIQEGTYARACAGLVPRETGDDLHARTLGLFARALDWIG